MNSLGTKRLETPRLILRAFEARDAEPMFRNWASDPEVTKFLTWKPYESAETASERMAFLSSRYAEKDMNWAIELKEIGEAIGSISVVELNERTCAATIGYCIGRAYWGQGIMAEALSEVMRFLFEEVGVNCVNACHDTNNPNSGRVMEKCGMRFDGLRRAAGFNNLGVCDEAWYSILKAEYFEKRK